MGQTPTKLTHRARNPQLGSDPVGQDPWPRRWPEGSPRGTRKASHYAGTTRATVCARAPQGRAAPLTATSNQRGEYQRHSWLSWSREEVGKNNPLSPRPRSPSIWRPWTSPWRLEEDKRYLLTSKLGTPRGENMTGSTRTREQNTRIGRTGWANSRRDPTTRSQITTTRPDASTLSETQKILKKKKGRKKREVKRESVRRKEIMIERLTSSSV